MPDRTVHHPSKPPFRKVLIANRGEIAFRIVHAAQELGIATVGVYSEADAHLPHLAQCDETVCIGPPASAESYLNMEKLIAVATEHECDCIHPGYGFLAENSDFARKVIAAGMAWIGPHPDAIDAMGDKIDSKRMMGEAGVPIIPGFTAKLDDAEFNRAEAERVGYPLLVKPTAGGGGKGMYVVREAKDLQATLEKSESEAIKSFGRGGLLVERFLDEPRHIEVQVLGDKHGHAIHLFERECSIQRRHQKLIEEAPSPFVGPELRERICAAGVAAAQTCGYDSAGTVECLVDGITGDFFFLEMNTRLQVEHPVTEQITGFDLAKAMFRVAAGEPLWVEQSDLAIHGHSIECRIIAEDPYTNFMPSFGPLKAFVKPSGPAVRVDSGFAEGTEVSQYYDSLIAKLITWGNDRDEAINRMLRSLDEFHIVGVQTCIPFHRAMLRDEPFVSGRFDVHTCEKRMEEGLLTKDDAAINAAVALAAAIEHLGMKPGSAAGAGNGSAAAGSGAGTGGDDLWRYSKRAHRLRDLRA